MKTFTLAMAFAAMLATGMYIAADKGWRRVEEAQALACARASIGTDSAICDCYTDRGLPIPEDMK